MKSPAQPMPVRPAHAERTGAARFALEAWDHLWPWTRDSFARGRTLAALSVAVALLVTVAWALAAVGQLRAGALIGWWLGWSALEVLVRLRAKPYVKDGPWWGRNYRTATRMDMLCYVLFKNLLVGVMLFMGLKAAGLLGD